MPQVRNDQLVELLTPDFVRNTGELHLNHIDVNAAYNAAAETMILATGGGAGITITLPRVALNIGKTYFIKKIDAGAGAITIDGFGAEKIEGVGSISLAAEFDSVILVTDGIQWYVWVSA